MTGQNILALADKCADAYSTDRYGSWIPCVRMLVRRGFDHQEIEAILRSKWTRWAADNAKNPNRPNSRDLERFLDDPRSFPSEASLKSQMAELVAGTFGGA